MTVFERGHLFFTFGGRLALAALSQNILLLYRQRSQVHLIEVSVELVKGALVMSVVATLAVCAVILLDEEATVLGLVPVT